jgi:hypothetical protein
MSPEIKIVGKRYEHGNTLAANGYSLLKPDVVAATQVRQRWWRC